MIMNMKLLRIAAVLCVMVSGLADGLNAQTPAAAAPAVPLPVWAKGPCPIGFRDSVKAMDWQLRVEKAQALTDTVQKRDALYALVKEALGPETVVHLATNKFPTQPNPADYMPYPVVNFDVKLRDKGGSGSW